LYLFIGQQLPPASSTALAYGIEIPDEIKVEEGLERQQVKLTPEQKQEALDTHNKLRNSTPREDSTGAKYAGGYPQNMYKVVWNAQLEEASLQAAQKCAREHLDLSGQPTESLKAHYEGMIGENIYTKHGYGKHASVGKFIGAWYGEVSDYIWAEQNCTQLAPNICLHFLQIIWDGVHEMGCAMNKCQFNTTGEYWTNFICQYEPAGNFRFGIPFETTTDQDQICTKEGLTRDTTYTNLCVYN